MDQLHLKQFCGMGPVLIFLTLNLDETSVTNCMFEQWAAACVEYVIKSRCVLSDDGEIRFILLIMFCGAFSNLFSKMFGADHICCEEWSRIIMYHAVFIFTVALVTVIFYCFARLHILFTCWYWYNRSRLY